jgi:GTPase SAR1 family protein
LRDKNNDATHETYGEVEVTRVKLMLLGHGEAGKTALMQRLI